MTSKKFEVKLDNILDRKTALPTNLVFELNVEPTILFSALMKRLDNSELSPRRTCNALRILTQLRGFGWSQELLTILMQFVMSPKKDVRSYCLDVLVMLCMEAKMNLTTELDMKKVDEQILPLMIRAVSLGVSAHSEALLQKLLKD